MRISIIGTHKYVERLLSQIGQSSLLDFDFHVYSHEDISYHDTYASLTQDYKNKMWLSMLTRVAPGLRRNYQRLSPSCQPSASYQNNDPSELIRIYPWMDYRELSFGDLSVCSKHKRAIDDFLLTNEEYLLVLEDDAIISENSMSVCQRLCNSTLFDYIDLAGGDGLTAQMPYTSLYPGFQAERIPDGATRTACAYLISRRAAKPISSDLSIPIMPIDWSISYSLSRLGSKGLAYWTVTPPFRHGSSDGIYTSWRDTH